MTFIKFLPVALMIGVVAALWVLIGSYFNLVLWVPFISWALYFVYDATERKARRIGKEIIGLTGGILFGYITLVVMPFIANIFGAALGLPVTVLLVATIIVLLELTNWFEVAPAYFFAYAGYFAYVFGGFAANKESALIPFWLLIILGLAIGYFTAFIRKKILEKEGLYGPAQKTVFDKDI